MALALVPALPKSRRRPRLRRIALDPGEAADAAQLRYVSDARPGLQRIRHGRSFRYAGADGEAVRDLPTLRRIRSLAIPPAWTRGVDLPRRRTATSRRWGATRAAASSTAITRAGARCATRPSSTGCIQFGRALPAIRERVEKDLARPGLPREKVLAGVVRLLETTLIRVGNAEYARDNGSYGLTTLRNRHVTVEGRARCASSSAARAASTTPST